MTIIKNEQKTLSRQKQIELAIFLIRNGIYNEDQKGLNSIHLSITDERLFSQEISRHGVSAVLFYLFNKNQVFDLIKWTKPFYYKSLQRSLKQKQVLREILNLLQSHQIETILLKGSYLEDYIYPHFSTRPKGDIDILVLKNNLQEIDITLQNNEFSRNLPKRKYLDKFDLDYNYSYTKHGILLEVHWHIISRHSKYDIPIEVFWNNKICLSKTDKTYCFSPEYQLIHLCLHAYRNMIKGSLRLLWILDISLFLKKYSAITDVERTILVSKTFNIEKEISSILCFVYHIFQNKELRKFQFFTSYQEVINVIASVEITENNDLNYFKQFKYIKGEINKLKYIFAICFPSVEYLKQRNEKSILIAYFQEIHRMTKKIFSMIILKWR